MKFNIGDHVELIDEPVKGYIIFLRETTIVIHTEEGFEMEVKPDEILPLATPLLMNISDAEISKALREKESYVRQSAPKKHIRQRNLSIMEVDLHIHHLVDTMKGMTNYNILTLQLETAKRKLDYAIHKRMQKIVFIHGVGEGVLKTELEYLFRGYKNITYYDADFQTYGYGATEVYIYQNY